MKIESVLDASFAPYGRVLDGFDNAAIAAALRMYTPLPEEGVLYVAAQPELEQTQAGRRLAQNFFGGMPAQLGFCNGRNTKLGCLDYHRDSEVNLGATDFILLLAKEEEVEGGALDTAKVRAFHCPAGVMIEVYATTLHYAPCCAKKGEGFRVLVALPGGTNGPKPALEEKNAEDKILWACNKWLLAHPDSAEAAQGAVAALKGENIDIAALI